MGDYNKIEMAIKWYANKLFWFLGIYNYVGKGFKLDNIFFK